MAKQKSSLTGIKEIARKANVSIGTVDRVLHDRGGVSEKTSAKIKKIVAEMDYRPNVLGRQLASGKVTFLVTLIPAVSSETSFWEAPLKGIEQAEEEILQYKVKIEKLFFDQDDHHSFVKQTNKILKMKPDGVLLAPSFVEESIRFTEQCNKLNIPYVFIDSDIPRQSSLSYVGPDLFRSGYCAADLVSYLVKKNEKVLLVNISKEIENEHHLLRKGEGFQTFFQDHNFPVKIVKTDIKSVDYKVVKRALDKVLEENDDTRLIFVTNSKVSLVANYFKQTGKSMLLIGYDFVKENIGFLQNGTINFLICQKSGEQAYRGVMTLYKHLVLELPVEGTVYMPIDVIMKTNYEFYDN